MLMIIVKVWCSQGSFKRLSAASQIGLEFDFLVFEERVVPGATVKKILRARDKTNDKRNPQMTLWLPQGWGSNADKEFVQDSLNLFRWQNAQVTFVRGSPKHEYFNFTLLPFIGTLYKSSVTKGFLPGMRQLPALFLLCNDMA